MVCNGKRFMWDPDFPSEKLSAMYLLDADGNVTSNFVSGSNAEFMAGNTTTHKWKRE